jgi:hypothetical protein
MVQIILLLQVVHLNPVGIETLKSIKGINMMPNPLTNRAVVTFESTEAGTYTFETIDVVGKVVASSAKTSDCRS